MSAALERARPLHHNGAHGGPCRTGNLRPTFPTNTSALTGIASRSGAFASKHGLCNGSLVGYLAAMSAADIIRELPKLTEADRRAIREVLLEIANTNPDVALCNQAALEGAQLLDRMEDDDARRQSR